MIKSILINFNYLKSIIHWIIWWGIAVTLIMILIVLSFFMPKKCFNFFAKIGCSVMMSSALIFPKLKGIKKKEIPYPAIYVANHVSFFDLFIAGTVLPGNPRGIELYSHFYTPIYGWFITRFGQISIQAGKISSLKKTLSLSSHILKNKERSLYIAPEGTRTENGHINNFKNGAFYISRINNVPVIPVVYKNLYNKNNKNSIRINYGTFDVIILSPVYPENFNNYIDMSNEVRSRMIKALNDK